MTRSATVRLAQSGLRSAARCDTLGQEGAALVVANCGVTLNVPAHAVMGLRLR